MPQTIHPLATTPLEIIIIDQHGEPNNKIKLIGLWDDLKTNPAVSPVIVGMMDAFFALNEDLYLYVDIVIGAHQYYVCQIV
jgi:hypothetical protein